MSQKKGSTREAEKARSLSRVIGVTGILVLGLGLFFTVRLFLTGKPGEIKTNGEAPPYRRVETRPVLPSSLFSGAVAEAYQAAHDMPDFIDQFYCYCQCKEYHGHKTLLTCFTDKHAANCDICLYQALTAVQMSKEGKSADAIRHFFSSRFAQ